MKIVRLSGLAAVSKGLLSESNVEYERLAQLVAEDIKKRVTALLRPVWLGEVEAPVAVEGIPSKPVAALSPDVYFTSSQYVIRVDCGIDIDHMKNNAGYYHQIITDVGQAAYDFALELYDEPR